MGFLGDFGKVFSRVGLGIVTGGTSEIARLVAPNLVKSAEGLLFPTSLPEAITTAALVAGVSPASIAGVKAGSTFLAGSNVFLGPGMQFTRAGQNSQAAAAPYTVPGTNLTPDQFNALSAQGVNPMGLNLGNILGGAIGGLGTFLGGGSASQALQSFTSTAFAPQPASTYPAASPFGGQAYPVAASGAQAMAAARAVATVGRSFFNKYPNLATVIQGYRNMGKNVTRAKLYSLMKRFGPELLVSGGILTAAAVSELMVAGPGRRRMNPGNVKALRRSMRRLESFHHLCQRADKLRRPRARRPSIVGGGRRTEITRVG